MLEDGQAGQAIPDDRVLERASELDRTILTLNRRHFVRLHDSSSSHAGMIACSFDPDFEAQGHRIHEAIAGAELTGRLIRVNRPG